MDALTTTSAVIDALGGTAAVARLTSRSMQAVSNWRERGFFSAASYQPISVGLAEKDLRADPRLWRSIPPSALISTGAAA
ncbi:hypothetical protein [Methylobacterium segetis]|uniref:hypothetical protein n=1 Tax=Methylobacterium segetis TaxID=2488750 RepID=UPI00104A6025|nr:hypothetical protein [Methylobacterium segetis]